MRWLLWGALAALVLAGVLIGGAYWQLMRWGDQPLLIDSETIVEMRSGESVAAFARRLRERGLLQQDRPLVWLARAHGLDTQLQAGEYQLRREATPLTLLQRVAAGDVLQHQLRIGEGETVRDLLARVRNNGVLVQTLEAVDQAQLQRELSLATPFAEGMFFPDTYQFVRGHTDREVLMRAHAAMLRQVAEVWSRRGAPLAVDDQLDLIILASIIEKETGAPADRAQISQVFHRRLELNMRLQTDPTVIYGLGASFDGNLTRAHLAGDTPYNTYRVRGLPPTPIALPSRAALEAAAHPADGDYLYFVARGDGSSQFSRTLEEHNRAVRKYQLGQSN